jgi:hypothetical protein
MPLLKEIKKEFLAGVGGFGMGSIQRQGKNEGGIHHIQL